MAISLLRDDKGHREERLAADLQRRSLGREREFVHGADVHVKDPCLLFGVGIDEYEMCGSEVECSG